MKIEKLPDEVIKKICAGEVITRPYNVVKELLENSIDAGSTNISITISSDVLTVKIEDNGHGIQDEDFKLLCETHCTSKLKERDGIMQISTYGFRGKALSSISQVAKITVKSKTPDSEFGYEAKYSYGKLTDFKPVSLRDGTSFVVKDIFYNNKIRELKFFKKINELTSISNLVFFYAVCNTQSRFVFFVSGKEKFMSKGSISCECNSANHDFKNQDNSIFDKSKTDNAFHSDLLTLRKSILEDLDINKFHSEACLDRKLSLLETFYNIKDKLHHFDSRHITLICNKPSTDFKKTVFILFVNGRLVENTSLKDYLTKIYQDFLPKYRYPLIYIEIRVPSEDIDINIHPSKKEVMFNHEDIITEILSRVIEIRLKGSYKSEIESNLLENMNNRPQLKRYKQSYSENQFNTKIYNDPTISSLYEQKGKAILAEDNKSKDENTLTGDELYKNILDVLQSENYDYSANIYSSLEEEEEVDSLFFKSLTFVGVNQNFEFYVQYNQYLLVSDLETFLLSVIREYFISNLGKLPTKQVQIPVFFDINHLEILKKYFSIEVHDHVITQVPVVYGQYNNNREDWIKLKIEDKNCHENVKIESILNILVEIYLKSFNLNSVSFNLIKRSTKGTKKNVEMFSVLSSLKDLYKKFGR
ncbi:DNA mismatch repair protein Mlh1 [Nosema bombycis CQ1]|uniref:DNA mismatch repair protein Mlh1 n=1 Tax=Nosema bombycis (strain CQ1 / CVCC 102059) TaxID=578461 RepID=R0MQA4_NOSB1|nr:DNA mismatch repair protein Mlh1 [Nosema bombycis CQ1]|eukprot:EOB15063.1 DNA mismatch repair protein Mlh1 [Nosema bombycis CQ1]